MIHVRSVSTGSTLAARIAGMHAATAETASNTAVVANIVAASSAFTPNRNDCTARPATHAPATPSAIPARTILPAWLATSPATFLRVEPSAMRIPISRRRIATEYASTPYIPTADKIIATIPNPATSLNASRR